MYFNLGLGIRLMELKKPNYLALPTKCLRRTIVQVRRKKSLSLKWSL